MFYSERKFLCEDFPGPAWLPRSLIWNARAAGWVTRCKLLNIHLPRPVMLWLAQNRDPGYYFNLNFNDLKRCEYDPADQKHRWQYERLKALLAYAQRHVPYYRGLFRDIGFSPESFHSLDDLKKLPVLTKATVRKHQKDFLSEEFGFEDLCEVKTSGTTGSPMTFYMDACQKYLTPAISDLQYTMAGLPRFSGQYVCKVSFSRKYLFKIDGNGNIFFNVALHDRFSLDKMIDLMMKTRFPVIQGFPSFFVLLAKRMKRRGLAFSFLRGIVGGFESILPENVSLLEEVLKAPFLDAYGLNEGAVFGVSCGSRRGTHLNMTAAYVEFEPAGYAEHHDRIIATPLYARAMPLIRYDTQDYAERGGTCPCGRADPLLKRVIGRETDVLFSSEGQSINYISLSRILHKHSDIIESQFHQTAKERLCVSLRVEDPSLFDLLAFRRQLKKLLGKRMALEISFVDAVPRTARGKVKFIINDLLG